MKQEDFDKLQHMVEEQIKKEPPPRVAFIGESGVGKSTTLNVLFNAGREVSNIEACTQEEAAFDVEVAKGAIRIYDMPGLGESLKKRDQHLATYKRVLESADVALWILDAQYRAVESIQRYLAEELKTINPAITNKMVFALNKADLVHPADWVPFANLPSEEQKNNIEARILDIRNKIREAVPTWDGDVIGYSALRYYNLKVLFLAMLDAMPRERRWVLGSREALADYLDTLDEELRIKLTGSQSLTKTPQEQVTDLLANMTEEQRAELLKNDESVGSFFTRLMNGKRGTEAKKVDEEGPELSKEEST
jgi:small GTP-binding protein